MTLAERLGRTDADVNDLTELYQKVIALRVETERIRIMRLLMNHGVTLPADLVEQIANPSDD